jgi:hypothetical protein
LCYTDKKPLSKEAQHEKDSSAYRFITGYFAAFVFLRHI